MIKYELFININKEIRYCLNSNAYNQGKRWDIYVRLLFIFDILVYYCFRKMECSKSNNTVSSYDMNMQ